MHTDIATLRLFLLIMQLIMGAVYLALWRAHPSERALPYWASGSIMCGLSSGLMPFNGILPESVLAIVANFAVAAGFVLLAVGIQVFRDAPVRWAAAGLIVGLHMAVVLVCTLVWPLTWVRVLSASLLIAGVLLWIARDLGRINAAQASVGARMLCAACVVTGIWFAIRGALQIVMRPTGSYASMTPDMSLIGIWVTVVFFFFAAVCLVIMLSEKLMARLHELALRDPLTGLFNRRAFFEAARSEQSRGARLQLRHAIVAMDLDSFKGINDRHGHGGGDAVLAHVGRMLRTTLRQGDIIARFGGEEFVMVMPGTDGLTAVDIADRVRRKLAASSIDHEGQPISVTASFGVSLIEPDEAVDTALSRADAALYAAKRNGRDQVALHPSALGNGARPETTLEWAPIAAA